MAAAEIDSADHTAATILVVEDDVDLLSTMVDVLEFEGYNVQQAMNGAQALDVMERIQPELILLDMRMPVMNGWEFAGILAERGVKVPVLVMTAAQDAQRWAQEIGAAGYVPKPFHLTDLLDTIQGLVGPAGRGGIGGSGSGPLN
jgi:urea transport system substrate-binding protein